ncbi:MAG: HAD hydrolase-like protein [Candidatus Eisenbacteria bacterium]|uniref:HAD hydrolase-like protein n=1 Tax=Eiseniibacteriota bacterium TaxID=2212470 RepID=A0A849SP88_UNCEI|nr:HAD hydrolase-like protein [Candidatus Eisenbacteria bacterium]
MIWLFDIDGTLLWTDGAAREAFRLALREERGIDDDLATVPFGGRTDSLILKDALAQHGETATPEEAERFWQRTSAHMEHLLTPERGRLLPGVVALLDHVAAEPDWTLALLTGNSRPMARVKLEHFGLTDRFAFGAFGDEGPNRDAVARLAVERARDRHGVSPERCIVLGDTEHDITCARAAGAHAVAVATGQRDRAYLAPLGADLLLESFEPATPLLEWARRL